MTNQLANRTERQAANLPIKAGEQLDTLTVARLLAQTGYFADVRDAAQAVAKILAGRELGFGPIASLMGIYFQRGKISYAANLMASAIKRSGRYDIRVVKIENDGCVLDIMEHGKKIGESTFTRQDAETAGLLNGPNKATWASYPRNMLFARAVSNAAKWYCSDVFGGVTVYTPEELGAVVDGETGAALEQEAPEQHVIEAASRIVEARIEQGEVIDTDAAVEDAAAHDPLGLNANLAALEGLQLGQAAEYKAIRAKLDAVKPNMTEQEQEAVRVALATAFSIVKGE